MKNGFYIECGAADGEIISNTLFFEVYRNWTGLLIEPEDEMFELLLTKKRMAYAVKACLSLHSYPEQVSWTKQM